MYISNFLKHEARKSIAANQDAPELQCKKHPTPLKGELSMNAINLGDQCEHSNILAKCNVPKRQQKRNPKSKNQINLKESRLTIETSTYWRIRKTIIPSHSTE